MTSNNPEQNKPEPPEPWEEEYETFVSGYQHCESEGYHFFNDQTENLKAFIRKIHDQAYERGYKARYDKQEGDSWARNSQEREQDICDARQEALREAVEVLNREAILYEEGDNYMLADCVRDSIESLQSLLTKPKEK